MIDKTYIKEFFMISSLKCSNCGSLGVLIGETFYCISEDMIPKNAKVIYPKDFNILTNEDWEKQIDKRIYEIIQNPKDVIKILPELEDHWQHSCNAIKSLLKNDINLQN